MEAAKSDDTTKLSNMIMCGDHSSFTKTELNMKETKQDEKEKPKERISPFYSKISPTSSRMERNERSERSELAQRPDVDVAVRRNRALVQAAVGSFHWPPYLVAVWVLVLLLTHLLHCVLNVLERVLPTLKHVCEYFRSCTEARWRAEGEGSGRVYSAGLGCLTGLLYTLYCILYGVHAIALWSLDPLCLDTLGAQEQRSDPKITNYEDDTFTTKPTSNA